MTTLAEDRKKRYRADIEAAKNEGRGNFFKIADGTTTWRVLPGQEPGSINKDFSVKVLQHFGVRDSKAPITCPKSLDDSAKCPICDRASKLMGSDDEQQVEEGKRIKASKRYYLGVIDRNEDSDTAGKIGILSVPTSVRTQIQKHMLNDDFNDVTDPNEGFDLRIEKSGKKLSTAYQVTPRREPTPIANTQKKIDKILAEQPELWKYQVANKYEDLLAFLKGEIERLPNPFAAKPKKDEDEDTDTTEDEDDEPVKPVAKKKPAAIVEDDDDEEEDPKPKAKVKPKPVVEDDDEDDDPKPVVKKKPVPVDDDDEEEDEDPKPVKAAATVAKKKAVVEDDDEEEDEEPVVKKKKPAAVVEDDDEEEDEDPKPKKSSAVSSIKDKIQQAKRDKSK